MTYPPDLTKSLHFDRYISISVVKIRLIICTFTECALEIVPLLPIKFKSPNLDQRKLCFRIQDSIVHVHELKNHLMKTNKEEQV